MKIEFDDKETNKKYIGLTIGGTSGLSRHGIDGK